MIYAPKEECDDGNVNEYDGCTTKCIKTPIYANLLIELPLNVSKFSDKRSVSLSLDNETNPDINGWEIYIDGYTEYVLNASQLNNSIELLFILNSSLINKYVVINIPNSSYIINSWEIVRLADYEKISVTEKSST
jgi:cysteine-rich repeat protein